MIGVDEEWDKRLNIKLRRMGLTVEQAGMVIGIVAEERMNADRMGYIRGFNSGYDDCEKKLCKSAGRAT